MKTLFRVILLVVVFLYTIAAIAQSHYPGQHYGKVKLLDKAKPKVMAFDLDDVTLLPSRFTENMEREKRWLLSIPIASLVHSFRNNAGVFSASEGGYSPEKGILPKLAGWESLDCDLRGHTTGHILSGLALMYATTKDPIFKIKSDSIVNALAEVQAALKQGGYLSAFPQGLIDRNLAGKSVWAPWYTLHKIYAGLIDQYLYCNNKTALQVVSKMGEWAYNKLQNVSDMQRTIMLRNEFGGINDAFYNLYAIMGNEHFKWLAGFFYHNEVLDPLKEKKDILNPKHANTYIPKLIGLARDYEIEGNHDNIEMADFFWNTVVDHHSFATGSNSDKEHFFEPDKISEHLSGYTGETCNVYNMLKLTRHLFIHQPDLKYADFYERALVNHILGQQDPATGMVAYFLPMKAGAHKVYSTADSSFWCCVGSGFENHAKYGEAIYYHNEDALYINLFIPSQLNWESKGLKLTQQTKFPENGKISFVIDEAPGSSITIKLRYPSWATSATVIKVNGIPVKVKEKPGSYIAINHKWKKDDRIEVTYPMVLHLIPANDDPAVVAIAYGPVVLAGEMGAVGFTGREPYSDPAKHNDYYTYNYNVPKDISSTLSLDKANISNNIQQVKNKPLTFKAIKENITLRPLYDIHRQRYVVYWNIK